MNGVLASDSADPIELQSENIQDNMSRVARKPVFGVFDQVQHKLSCTATEYGKRLEISDLENRGIVLSM